jgi:hypothetical protein
MFDSAKKSLLALVLVLSFSTSAAGSSLVGDISGNGTVGLEDLKILTDYWLDGGCSAPNCAADLDGIAGVNMRDYAFLAADFGWGSWGSISVQEYRDKMKGGWVGQMVGVSWGAPTEFGWMGEIIPQSRVPRWRSNMINNAFGQDDLYVEMTFLRSLELYGLDVSIIQAGNDFADSSYQLWHANYEGRNNLRSGVIPPNSGHPEYNNHADDIDYQIEADYSGLIAPGIPNAPIKLGEKFGRLMNYGDGVYAGQFIGGMYAEAFFETDMETVVRAGLECIPQGSQYYECVNDVLTWYGANPNWEDTWQLINNKYHLDPNYRRFSCDTGAFNIDAKINGAYVVMGLLYGNGDPDDTITISMRCGQDSDCNPSSAAGILFTSMGYSNVPSRFKSSLNEGTYFSYTDYNFPLLMGVCEDLARQVVLQAGGSIGEDPCNPGEEIFIIPVSSPVPSELLQSWDPDPPINPIPPGMPYIVITSPSNGDIFGEGSMITITADACDVNGSVTLVEFFDGAAKLGEDPNEPYSFDFSGASLGAHSLQAKATDNDGNTTTSATVNISVSPAGVAGVWRSFNVIMNATSPQATVTDGNAVTADLEFYESTNNNGVDKGSLFGTYTDGTHAEGFNSAEHLWGDTSGAPYPYAAKSTVARGSGSGEANTPSPLGVFDLQLHPPENDHLTVAAFIVPEAGSYSVYDLAVRRVHNEGDLAGYKAFDDSKSLLTHIVATTDQDWVTDPTTYNLGTLQAGDRIYFAVDREDTSYGWDATEIIWTIEKN